MKSINLKKLILPNLPYLLFVYLFDKVGQAARLAPGTDFSGKLLSIGDGFAAAFSSFAPSLHPADFLVGILGAALIRLIVYVKGKNAKKYRRGVEYGSARWGSADDIRPYIDPVFENNVLLTQTERLMMNSRPKQPKYARNKKVAFNLTKRQLIFFAAALLVGLPLFFLLKDSAGTSLAAFVMILVMLPCFLLAMYEKHGQPLETLIKNIIQTKFIRPKERPYQTENFYAVLERQRQLEKEVSAIVNGKRKTRRKQA